MFFLETWSNFDIVAKICWIDALGATKTVVITLRISQTLCFLNFSNLENAFDIFLHVPSFFYHLGNTITWWHILVSYV